MYQLENFETNFRINEVYYPKEILYFYIESGEYFIHDFSRVVAQGKLEDFRKSNNTAFADKQELTEFLQLCLFTYATE